VLAAIRLWDRGIWRALAWSAAAPAAIGLLTMVVVPYREFESFFLDVLLAAPIDRDTSSINRWWRFSSGSLRAEVVSGWTGHEAVTVSHCALPTPARGTRRRIHVDASASRGPECCAPDRTRRRDRRSGGGTT
jgi:hypothetical protein